MFAWFYVAAVALAALASLLFATLNFALRDVTRTRLERVFSAPRAARWLAPTVEHRSELIIVTAVARLVANTLIGLTLFDGLNRTPLRPYAAFWLAAVFALALTFFFSVALPHSLADIAGAPLIAAFAGPLHALRKTLQPFSSVMKMVESRVQNTVGPSGITEPQMLERELLSVVAEGEKEGVVDKQERVMIESVIRFHDTIAGQIMTPRADIVAIGSDANLNAVKTAIERSGHSRIPVYQGTLDQIVGVLYARDVLRHLGQTNGPLDIKTIMRPAFFVPESKTLRDLLHDFRQQKVHMAVVLDEYGGTAGVVTIEDMLEELIGEIADEHEPHEAPLFKQVNDQTAEADARLHIEAFNQLTGLSLPEDAGYETVGGFISTTLGHIPEVGTVVEYGGAKFTVLDAEPQKVNRVRVEISSRIPNPKFQISDEAGNQVPVEETTSAHH